MAIPFKSPISFGYTTLSEDSGNEFKINAAAGSTFTLGPHTAGIETGDGNKIAFSPSGISLTGNNISIDDLNDRTIFASSSTILTIGNNAYPTMIRGSEVYLYNSDDPIIEAGSDLILLGNNTKNTNIKGSNVVIDGSRLTVPTDTRLKSIAENRVFTSQSLACIQDINNAIISKVQFSHT